MGVTACEASSFCTSDLLYVWRGGFAITTESLESLSPFLPNASAQEIRSEINSCQLRADSLLSIRQVPCHTSKVQGYPGLNKETLSPTDNQADVKISKLENSFLLKAF